MGAVADLFVERVPRASTGPALAATSRVLMVDACGRQFRFAELTRILESLAPVVITCVRFEALDDTFRATEFDRIWLFVDEASDVAYCGLAMRELNCAQASALAELVAVGRVDDVNCALELAPSRVGLAPPWRRRRELERGAEQLADCLLGARGARG
ncbi:MAG: hypothetical protein JHD02_04670 [Thermoleophilaceae bacterium]|nr:hypothetical protein [Thermoleophilaceae bacterium]